ncbi:hypothetical protein AYL99_10884 [Fonsecaea erecta]|uniref:Uncharacterized protein n=1 Tax=Fonsecaea erecta TaxID=1367422 RepID=A0A178Z5Z1_9EURO|nr:hypothetical protein AYL99_10884 [Fonsecaea erecta]OAP55184.1 hypothetical protein AYL99_10884 [Fonsecaea erecta]
MGDPGPEKVTNGDHTVSSTNGTNGVVTKRKRPIAIDEPVGLNEKTHAIGWGSDAIAEQIARLDIPYIALSPGSSYRGLHDSLVNYNGNTPQMIVCLHEEHTVAVAHGYSKVTEKPMLAAVHANVGLQHASMAIYNAFCDRVPVVILGATGPLDSERKRPWIDWIHTCTDQAAIVRPSLKFDEQPYSVNAATKALARCYQVSATKPCAPSYLCLDVCLQEDKFDASKAEFPDLERMKPLPPQAPAPDVVDEVVALLAESKRPLLMFGRVNRSQKSWDERVELAETVGAYAMTDLKQGAAFPSRHPLHPAAPAVFTTPQNIELINAADLLISFDWVDLAGTLKAAGTPLTNTKVVHISMDSILYNGWCKDHFAVPPTDVPVFADPDRTLSALLAGIKSAKIQPKAWSDVEATKRLPPPSMPDVPEDKILMGHLASNLFEALGNANQEYCLIRLPYGWRGYDLNATGPLSFLGLDGGAGIGSGPGQTVGSALALKDSGRLAVSILGDGDFLMGGNALWTAAHCRLPCLILVANNRSFYNDEVHQERVARARDRPWQNKGIGQQITDPTPDLNTFAKSLGLTVPGPCVTDRKDLPGMMAKAVKLAQEGHSVVIDIAILPDGYSSALEKAR